MVHAKAGLNCEASGIKLKHSLNSRNLGIKSEAGRPWGCSQGSNQNWGKWAWLSPFSSFANCLGGIQDGKVRREFEVP